MMGARSKQALYPGFRNPCLSKCLQHVDVMYKLLSVHVTITSNRPLLPRGSVVRVLLFNLTGRRDNKLLIQPLMVREAATFVVIVR